MSTSSSTGTSAPPSRGRRGVVVAAGTAAAAAGLGFGLWHRGTGSSPAPSGADLPADFWSMRFPKPGGGEVAMAGFRGRPLLLNFWATWCPPCVREMPEIDRFAKQFRANGWQVLGLAADQDKPVRDFLGSKPVGYPIALAGFEGVTLSRALGNESGALPFTAAISAAGRVTQRHLGETTFDQLAAWAHQAPPPRTP